MDEKRREKLTKLLTVLRINKDTDLQLINQALTHPSFISEGGGNNCEHYQRLEFLGDAVIGLVIARYLFEKYPDKSEGELTKIRAAVVCEASLAEAAMSIQLGDYLLMGKGEEMMGGAMRSSNLADCFEALMGALYMTSGLEKVRLVVINMLKEKIRSSAGGLLHDYKTKLQEHIQKTPNNKISYQILLEEGPDHEKFFLAGVFLNEVELARGGGHTKKEAEQHAARIALEILGEE